MSTGTYDTNTFAKSLREFLDEETIAALNRPTAEATGLPGSTYCSPEFLELERELLFSKTWVAAAMASEVLSPGDVKPVNVAGLPLVFTRAKNGVIHCFQNICRHRGAALVTESQSNCRVLRCPWHSWTYELDGRLRGTPDVGGAEQHWAQGICPEKLGLIPVRVEQWFDFLFVNLDGQAPPLEQHLAPLLKRLSQFDFSRLHYAGTWNHHYDANWKISVASAIEDYHLPWLHPQIAGGQRRAYQPSIEWSSGCYYAVFQALLEFRAGGGLDDPDLPTLPLMPGLAGPDSCSTSFVNVFPTGILGVAPDYVYAGVWLPDGPGRTTLAFHFYYVDEGAFADKFRPVREHIVKRAQEVFTQDSAVLKSVQERAPYRIHKDLRNRYSTYWEGAVHQFERQIANAMLEAAGQARG